MHQIGISCGKEKEKRSTKIFHKHQIFSITMLHKYKSIEIQRYLETISIEEFVKVDMIF